MLEEKHSEGIPKYIQLAKILREKILAQEYKPGEQIPTEADLCGKYNVSRITVREAIKTILRALPPDRFAGMMAYPWPRMGSLSDLIAIMAEHERQHADDIRQALQSGESG